MKKLFTLALILIACEKEGVYSDQDASSARRGPAIPSDAITLYDQNVPGDTNRPDQKEIDLSPDTTPLSIGTKCSRPNDCSSKFCTDGVCCIVEKCVDTCVPGMSACTPYAGFTCSPLGTCRGF